MLVALAWSSFAAPTAENPVDPLTDGRIVAIQAVIATVPEDCDYWCDNEHCLFPEQQHEVLAVAPPDEEPNSEDHPHECSVYGSCEEHECDVTIAFADGNGPISELPRLLAELDGAALEALTAQEARAAVNVKRQAIQVYGCSPDSIILSLPLTAAQVRHFIST